MQTLTATCSPVSRSSAEQTMECAPFPSRELLKNRPLMLGIASNNAVIASRCLWSTARKPLAKKSDNLRRIGLQEGKHVGRYTPRGDHESVVTVIIVCRYPGNYFF